jgi:hypothetical protein
MNAFIYRLTAIHRKLDDEIRRELKRRFPDNLRLRCRIAIPKDSPDGIPVR